MQAVEPVLETLIRAHGAEAVRTQLSSFFPTANWSVFQRVQIAVDRIARRVETAQQTANHVSIQHH